MKSEKKTLSIKLATDDTLDFTEIITSAVRDAMKQNMLDSSRECGDSPNGRPSTSNPGGDSQQSEVDKTLDSLARARRRGQIALNHHAERFGGVPWEPTGKDSFGWRRFDGLVKRGSDIVVLEFKSVRMLGRTKMSLVNSVYEWNAIKDRLRSFGGQNLSFEILFCADESFRRTSAFDDMIQRVIGSAQPDIRVYLYRFTQNDTIKDSEEIR